MTALLCVAAQKLRNNRRGQDMIEYALIAGFVAVAAGAIFPTTLMPGVSTIFSKLNDYFVLASAQGN
jgi:Flp pilus assembly pilin Flp